MSLLFSPLTIKNTVFKNRMVVSPMCMYSSEDGFATDFHLVHLGSRALGGAGLIIQEGTAVSPEGRITYADLGIWKDAHIPKLKQIVSFCRSHNSLMGIQLAHAGRKGSTEPPFRGGNQIPPGDENGWQTVSASPLAFKEGFSKPGELTLEEMESIKNDFVAAAKRAEEIGYDVLEIHAAHGYLFHQFYSPLSNKRTDAYGGSFENRIRFLLEVTGAVREEWGDQKPLFVRISATDWVEGGWDIGDSVKLAKALKSLGVDLIDTSSGGNVPHAKIFTTPGYQSGFSGKIRKEAGILTGAVGKITEATQSEDLLKEGKADLIFYARHSLRYPNLPYHFAAELGEDISWPVQYERAKRKK